MKLLSTDQLLEMVPLSRPKLNRLITRAAFPQPMQVGQTLMWVEQEVLDWLAAQPRGLFQQAPALKQYQAQRKGDAKCQS